MLVLPQEEFSMNIRFGLLLLFIVGCSALPVFSVLRLSDAWKKKCAISMYAGKKSNG